MRTRRLAFSQGAVYLPKRDMAIPTVLLRGPGMTDFRAKRAPSIPGRAIHPVANAKVAPLTGREKRRGVRVNSRVPVAVEWHVGGEVLRKETQTRVVGPYGGMGVLPMKPEVG